MRIVLDGEPAAGSCACASVAKSTRAAAMDAENRGQTTIFHDAMSMLSPSIRKMVVCPRFSVEFGTRGLDDLAHLCDIGLDLRRELLGRVRDGLDSIFVQALEEIRPPDDRDRVVVNLLHYVTRHACRGHKAVPGLDVETGKRFGDRGHVGPRLCPFGAGDAERLQ